MMAIAKGQVSNSGVEFKKYIGVGEVKVIGVNPTKAQIKELMGYEPNEEPVYFGVQEIDGKKYNYARIDFIVKTDAEKTGIDYTGRVTFFLRNQYRQGSQSGKYQVLDLYNNQAWATEADIKAQNTIMYSNGPAKIIGKYRPAYIGEWEFINFIRHFAWIGSAGDTNGFDYANGTWIEKKGQDLKECECSFSVEEIQSMFKGNFSAVRDAIAVQPNNTIKLLFGIKTDNGKEYQDIYTKRVLRSNNSNYSKLQEEIESSKAAGSLSNRTYEFCNLKEYVVTPTDFSNANGADDPLSQTASPW